MKHATHSLALQIRQILEEYSSDEIRVTIEVLKENGASSELLEYLSQRTRKHAGSNGGLQPAKTKKKTMPMDLSASRAVLDLKKKDPEKHRILAGFDRQVRQGKVLKTNNALKRFGETISKRFQGKPSKKASISAVMTLLASLPQADMERFIQTAMDNRASEGVDGYLSLANYIIRGRTHAGVAEP